MFSTYVGRPTDEDVQGISLQLPRIPTTARWRTEWLMSGSSRIGFVSVPSGLSGGQKPRGSHSVHRMGLNWDLWDSWAYWLGYDVTATVGKTPA